MQYAVLTLFLLLSSIHLYHSWHDAAKHRAMTKPFLLLLLAIFYVCAAPRISLVLLLALLTSWLGDVLLIPKGHKWFIIGGVSFLTSHFLFIAVYAPAIRWTSVPLVLLVLLAVVYYGVSLRIILAVRPTTPKIMVAPMYLYLLANGTMNLFALTRLFTLRTAGSAVAYAGAVLFFISDCVLFLVRYHRDRDIIFKRHFSVMLTYLTGEMLIVLGMLMNG